MKHRLIAVLVIALTAFQAFAAEAPVLKSKDDSISYAAGVEVARNFKKQDIKFDADLFIKGLKDELAGRKLLLSEIELRAVMNKLQGEVRRKAVAERQTAALDNRKKESEFLSANKAKEGVVALPSGVQYKVLKAGDGKKPADNDTVVCSYHGSDINGTEFEATEDGKPATLLVSRLIPGWREALKLMPAGSHWQIVVPSKLAYGERGMGSEIGPNETLVFDVKLLEVK